MFDQAQLESVSTPPPCPSDAPCTKYRWNTSQCPIMWVNPQHPSHPAAGDRAIAIWLPAMSGKCAAAAMGIWCLFLCSSFWL